MATPAWQTSLRETSCMSDFAPAHDGNWHQTVEEVATWLADLGYDDAALQARHEEIDGESLSSFSQHDFQLLGLKLGDAKKIATWIRTGQADCMGAVSRNPSLKCGHSKNLHALARKGRADRTDAVGEKTGVDSSLVLGAERTLYAAQQMGWNVIFVGIGLMMVTEADEVPNMAGMASIVGGIAFIFASWLIHLKRLRDFSVHRHVSLVMSGTWTFVCAFLFTIAVGIELYFAVIYPYLMRTKQVEINN